MQAAALRVLCLAALAGLAGDASRHAAEARTGTMVTVTGTLTSEGVPCRALRGDDGILYTFRRSPATNAFNAGDRIRLEGTIATASTCQQGTTLTVISAEKIN